MDIEFLLFHCNKRASGVPDTMSLTILIQLEPQNVLINADSESRFLVTRLNGFDYKQSREEEYGDAPFLRERLRNYPSLNSYSKVRNLVVSVHPSIT